MPGRRSILVQGTSFAVPIASYRQARVRSWMMVIRRGPADGCPGGRCAACERGHWTITGAGVFEDTRRDGRFLGRDGRPGPVSSSGASSGQVGTGHLPGDIVEQEVPLGRRQAGEMLLEHRAGGLRPGRSGHGGVVIHDRQGLMSDGTVWG